MRRIRALLTTVVVVAALTACDPVAPDASTDAATPRPHHARVARHKAAHHTPARPAVAPAKPDHRPRLFLVTRIIDGDTLELGNGETVRLVGMDTPEVGECGYQKASDHLASLVLGKRVHLSISDEDRDRYGRLLRYVDVGSIDAGLNLIRSGLAVARYDSRDGYGFHERQPQYISADRRTPNQRCAAPVPLVQHSSSCEPGYQPCVPLYPPDLDCADLQGPIHVTGPDPHGLDADGDGWGCE